MNVQFELTAEDGSNEGVQNDNVSRDGFNGLCDSCDFFVSCRPGFEEVKNACDEHNRKNPGHDAAPINCTF